MTAVQYILLHFALGCLGDAALIDQFPQRIIIQLLEKGLFVEQFLEPLVAATDLLAQLLGDPGQRRACRARSVRYCAAGLDRARSARRDSAKLLWMTVSLAISPAAVFRPCARSRVRCNRKIFKVRLTLRGLRSRPAVINSATWTTSSFVRPRTPGRRLLRNFRMAAGSSGKLKGICTIFSR